MCSGLHRLRQGRENDLLDVLFAEGRALTQDKTGFVHDPTIRHLRGAQRRPAVARCASYGAPELRPAEALLREGGSNPVLSVAPGLLRFACNDGRFWPTPYSAASFTSGA